jgi:hypothetical protein
LPHFNCIMLEFHCDISINEYSILWSHSAYLLLFLLTSPVYFFSIEPVAFEYTIYLFLLLGKLVIYIKRTETISLSLTLYPLLLRLGEQRFLCDFFIDLLTLELCLAHPSYSVDIYWMNVFWL